MTVQAKAIAAEAEHGRDGLARAEAVVTCTPAVLRGTPCFAGTRIPVHDIADMLANGDSRTAILQAYPQLTAEMVALAPLYAAGHPRPAEPPAAPAGRREAPTQSKLLRLDDLPQPA